MNLTNNIVTLSPAERAMLSMCVATDLNAKPAAEVLSAIDQKLDSWVSGSVIDVVNLRIIEKIRNNLAVMAKFSLRALAELPGSRATLRLN